VRTPVTVDDNIGGFQVAVNDALLMRVTQRIAQLEHDIYRAVYCQVSAFNEIAQQLTVDVGHRNEVAAFVLTNLVNRDYVGVMQCGGRFSFVLEPLEGFRIPRYVGRQKLKSYLALQLGVLSEIHFAHATLAKLRQDLIV
jgi:hypothetical protein